ncbi:MAG: hypothetical protein JWM95_5441 [Gemmatimonadetes bacterium]|nr:hypothetical protein [Gemmatimonadota bacterium]
MVATDPNALDASLRTWVVTHQWPLAIRFFTWVSIIGSVNPLMWVCVAGAGLMAFRRRGGAAVALLVAPLAAYAAHTGLKRVFARARPVGLRHVVEDTYSFPSAHATTAAAVCCALAYVSWREGLVPPAVAVAFAVIIPLLVGASRIYLDAHWTTDVIGGWAIGMLISAASGMLYNRLRLT